MSATDKVAMDRVETDFTYHTPDEDKQKRHDKLRDAAKAYAKLLVECCPESRERSLALTKLQEAVMWANASVALH